MSAGVELTMTEPPGLPDDAQLAVLWNGAIASNGDRYAASNPAMAAYPIADTEVYRSPFSAIGFGTGHWGLGRFGFAPSPDGRGYGLHPQGFGFGHWGTVEDARMTIRLAGVFRDGWYRIQVANQDGAGNQEAGLAANIEIIGTTVRAPTGLRITDITGTTVTVSWRPSPDVLVAGGD